MQLKQNRMPKNCWHSWTLCVLGSKQNEMLRERKRNARETQLNLHTQTHLVVF
jgi:hypothetical protein